MSEKTSEKAKTVQEIDPEINLWDYDGFVEQKHHEWFRTLRNTDPGIHWSEANENGPGFWSITRHEHLKEASRHAEVFSSNKGGININEPNPDEEFASSKDDTLISMDPPKHTRYRKLLNRGFTPRMINMIQGYLENRARIIVDKVSEKGEAEFVEELAAELPLQAIAEIVGIPVEERKRIFEWTNRMIGSEDPDLASSHEHVMEAFVELYAYADKLQKERMDKPRKDILTSLLQADIDGESLTETEFNMFFLVLCVAGNETTRNSISWGIKAFMENPDQWQKFCSDPDKYMETTIEEIIRWATPVMHFRRQTLEDCEIGGVKMKKDQKVILWYLSANRDERVFDNPYKFDIERESNEQISFGGGGPHYCLGANLARMQIRIMFKELANRLPDISPNGDPKFLRSNFIGGIKELPVKFTPSPSTNTEAMSRDVLGNMATVKA